MSDTSPKVKLGQSALGNQQAVLRAEETRLMAPVQQRIVDVRTTAEEIALKGSHPEIFEPVTSDNPPSSESAEGAR
jgi:hypothetical protein